MELDILGFLLVIVLLISFVIRYINLNRRSSPSTGGSTLGLPTNLQRIPSTYPWESIILFILLPIRAWYLINGTFGKGIAENNGWINSIQMAWANARLGPSAINEAFLVAFIAFLQVYEERQFRKDALDRLEEVKRFDTAKGDVKKDDSEKAQSTIINTKDASITSEKSTFDQASPLEAQSSSPTNDSEPTPTRRNWSAWRDWIKATFFPRSVPPTPTAVLVRYHVRIFTKLALTYFYLNLVRVSSGMEGDQTGSSYGVEPALWLNDTLVPGLLLICVGLYFNGLNLWRSSWRFSQKYQHEIVY